MHRAKFLLLTSACVTASACVTMEVDRKIANPESAVTPTGELVYALPKTLISLSGTITLNDCDAIVASNLRPAGKPDPRDGLPDRSQPVAADISENFAISTVTVADIDHQYAIPFDSLRNWTKQLNVTVGTYSNKTLQTVSGTITDQAGPVAMAAVQATVAIGGAASIAGAGAPTLLGDVDVSVAKREFKGSDAENFRILAHGKTKISLSEAIKSGVLSPEGNNKLFSLALRDHPIQLPNAPICTASVRSALTKIARLAREIAVLQQAGGKKPVPGAAPSASDSSSIPNQTMIRDLNEIAEISTSAGLTRQINIQWDPKRAKFSGGEADLTSFAEKPLAFFDNEMAAWFDEPARAKGLLAKDDRTLRFTRDIYLTLAVKRWTIGAPMCVASDTPKTLCSAYKSGGNVGGLVIRDPALAILRACLDHCVGFQTRRQEWLGSLDLDDLGFDITNDIAPLMPVSLNQLGRLSVHPLKNVLFETSTLSATLNADGSIASIGSQTANAAAGAAGLGAVSAAASSQAASITARNTAIGAVNGATLGAATYADNVNKALADCLAQQQAIIAAGGRPIGRCQ